MKVTLIASTAMYEIPESVEGTAFADFFYSNKNALLSDADTLSHFAGRSCYQAWDMKRESTATNQGYLSNILEQGHESVLEHGSATFYVEGVSRTLLTELTRHRHLNYSVESQRYVDYSKTKPVYPPAADTMTRAEIYIEYIRAVAFYKKAVERFLSQGLTRKESREAARSFLPNCAPVAITVTGNHRAWREVLGKRLSLGADREIQLFAAEILRQLKELAPACYQDM